MPAPAIITPFAQALNLDAINNLISWAGINVFYMKGHACPCSGDTGSPNPRCVVCFGRGVYWDPIQGPFIVLITMITWLGRNVAIGDDMDPNYGMVFEGHPIITIQNVPATEIIYTQTNTNDIFVQKDATMRFQATLRVGENTTIPAWQILGSTLTNFSIAPTGAVVVEDPTIVQPVKSGVSYSISGGTVTLSGDYPKGTSYTVEYYSQPTYVVQEQFGGLMHARPFGQGVTYPHRYKMSLLDLWLRDKIGSSTNLG